MSPPTRQSRGLSDPGLVSIATTTRDRNDDTALEITQPSLFDGCRNDTDDEEVDFPAEYSPEVIALFGPLLRELDPAHVHDCYGGMALRLGALCDDLGITFTASDIDDYPACRQVRDPRVQEGDATVASTYPCGVPFVLVTSPPYFDKRISSDYLNGPTPRTKLRGRRSYGIAKGGPLHPGNLARACRPGHEGEYYRDFAKAVRHWPEVCIVNVDGPMCDDCCRVLEANGYRIERVEPVNTRRYGFGANRDKRPDHEVVILARRPAK